MLSEATLDLYMIGEFTLANERFSYELHDYGPGFNFAPRLINPSIGANRAHHHIRVRLTRVSDGLSRELSMHPSDSAVADVCGFIRGRVNFELTQCRLEDISPLFDRPQERPDLKCLWC